MPSDRWDPTEYNRFRAERSQPLFDLLSLVRASPGMTALDLGAGTGEWTRHLHVALAAATTLGIDRSDAMLAKAAELEPAPGLSFAAKDIATWARGRRSDESYDLIFSNAALHWLPSHDALFASLRDALRPHGQLAVQVPANFDHPTHVIAADLARDAAFAAELTGQAAPSVLAPERYATLLHRLGFVEQHVRLQVYAHVLPKRDDVLAWVKGTLLTDYASRLSAGSFATFLGRYRERLFAVLPDERPFFYPFKRILLWARRGA